MEHPIRLFPVIFILAGIGLGTIDLSAQTAFKTVKIDRQVWMAENLNVCTFQNGDSIPEAESAEQWKNATVEHKPAWCYYRADSSNGCNRKITMYRNRKIGM